MQLMNPFIPFFNPRGIVIVGARRSPGFGYAIPVSLIRQGWGDRMYLVNPIGGELHGKTVYKSLSEVPDPVDLAVIIVPSASVPDVMRDIGERGIKNVILESAGFAEIGEKGKDHQDHVLQIAKKYGIRIIGPNCVGLVNTENKFSTVEVVEQALRPGPVSIIAQSGMFGTGILDFAYERGIYISKTITLGNRMDVTECEILDYLHTDENTKAIMMYLESASDGRTLIDTLDRVSKDKPVMILKSGRTQAGKKATESHTGSLSGQDEIYDAVFAQTNSIRADNIEELLAYSQVFSTQPLPKGNRLGIITSSGSMGVMATDVAISLGLSMPQPSEQTVKKVKAGSPPWMNVKNPLDSGPSTQYPASVEAMLEDPDIDMVLAIIVIPSTVAREFKANGVPPKVWFGDMPALRKIAPDKPFILCSMSNMEFCNEIRELAGESTPVIFSPDVAAKALYTLWNYARKVKRNEFSPPQAAGY